MIAWRAPGRSCVWVRPEWWVLGLSAAAWVTLFGLVYRHAEGAHAEAWTRDLGQWVLMVIAMMLPLVLEPIRVTTERSLWRRRQRAVAGFVVGYLGTWLVAGVLLAGVASLARGLIGPAGALGFLCAAGWQLTPAKRRALAACHKTQPLAPSGFRADLDCLRYGTTIGTSCIKSCWALMLACVLTEHDAAATLIVMGFGIAERYLLRPRRYFGVSVLFGVALIYVILFFEGR